MWTTTASSNFAADPALLQEQQRLRELLDLRADIIGLGVDRLDYTKGIPERLDALDALMAQRPDLRGRLTFVQIGVPSRSDLKSYAAIEAEIGERIAAINARYAVPGGSPVVSYYTTPLGAFSLVALYRLAHFCIVSSLHDGMNLVAKEFVAARDDEHGVLVLSALAGAAQELEDAVIINPYDIDAFAAALARAIRHDERRPDDAHASHAEGGRRTERLQLGVRHPGGSRESLDQAAALLGSGLGRDVGLMAVKTRSPRGAALQPITSLATRKAPLQERRCRHGRDNHHGHHRREDGLVDDRLARKTQTQSDIREDQPDLTAGHHPDTNG